MKKGRKKRGLTPEDRELWRRVAATTQPLRPRSDSVLREEMERLMGNAVPSPDTEPAPNRRSPVFPPPAEAPPAFVPQPLEDKTLRQLAKGKKNIDSRIDLHGMTQDRARAALLDFLQMAQRAGHRIVLVITGKGERGQGILRQSVPRWLDTPAFAGVVNGYRNAHVSHGGEGALYVRLRRLR